MALGILDDIKITEIADAIRAVEKSTDPIPFEDFKNRIIDSQLSTAEARGTIISLDDVSPVAHPVEVAASNKNLIPYPYINWSRTMNGVTFTDNGDGSITLQGTAEKTFDYHLVNSVLDIPTGVPLVVSGGILTENEKKVVVNVRRLKPDGTQTSFIEHAPTATNPSTGQLSDGEKINYVGIYIYEGAILDHTIYPQLEYGSVATEYFPYVPVINKNLIPYPYRNTTQTKNEVTFTDNGDGSITINGTPTALTTHALYIGTDAFKFSKYTSCASGSSIAQDGLCMSLALVGESVSTLRLAYETATNPILYIKVDQGVTYNNITVYPKIEEGSVSTNFRISQKTRNLIPFPYADKSITQNGGTFTINDDGSVTCSGTPTGYAGIMLNRRVFLEENSRYALSAQGEHTNVKVGYAVYNEAGELLESSNANSTRKIQIIDTSKYTTKVYLDISVARFADNQEMTGTVYPQLELGSTMTQFMPYGTIGVKSCGKNLIDGSYHEQGVSGAGITIQYLPEEDAYLLNGTATRHGNLLVPEVYIPVNGKIAITAIHLSGTVEKGTGPHNPVFYVGGVDTYRAANANWTDIILPNSGTATIISTTPKNYMSCFWFYFTAGNIFNNYKCRIMVEKGDKATEYEPYKGGQEVPIKLHETAKLNSISPNMTIYSTDGGVLFNASYLKGYANIDLDKFIDSSYQTQIKAVTYTKNGAYTISADEGYDALSKVQVSVAVQPDFEVYNGELEPRIFTVSGVWVFNENIIYSQTNICEKVNFVSNGISFDEMQFTYESKDDYNTIAYMEERGKENCEPYVDGWDGVEAYRTIDFGTTPQEVSKEFYNWLTVNAVKQ